MPQPALQRVGRVFDATRLTVKAWKFLEDEMRRLKTPLSQPVVPVLDFRAAADAKPTTREERLAIIEQAELMFEHFYPHMPFKTDLFHFVHPRVYLQNARAEIDGAETAFHAWLIAAFSIVRDAHTIYGLPSPYRGATAFLPFQMASIIDPAGERRFIVSRIMNSSAGGFGHDLFGPGAEIVKWAGLPIEYHVLRAAGRLPGGNPSAEFARATLACTIRPLTFCQFPFEEEMPTAEIVYRTEPMAKDLHVIRFPWGVVRFPSKTPLPTRSFSVNLLSEEFERGRRSMCPAEMWKALQFEHSQNEHAVSRIPEVFEFQFTGGPRDGYPISLRALAVLDFPNLRFGYLRIKAFTDGTDDAGASDRLVGEARRILSLLDEKAPDGLIIDIRGNPGGDIEAAERMLQMLTPRAITPENFHFANSRVILNLLRETRAPSRKPLSEDERRKFELARHEFQAWLDDADADPYPDSAERLTSGQPLTSPANCNDIGQVYHGRIVLLTDAFTYSAADIFAAGFEDHDIGFILGKDGATGGGGANVWNHRELVQKLGPASGLPLAPLPRDVTMRLAIRRCTRVGRNAGRPVEDLGVNVRERYITNIVQDVLADFPGLVTQAAIILATRMRMFRVDASGVRPRGDGVSITLRSTNVTRMSFFLDGKLAATRPIDAGATRTFVVPPVNGVSEPSRLRIEGFSNVDLRPGAEPRLVTVRNIALRDAQPARQSLRAARRRRRRR